MQRRYFIVIYFLFFLILAEGCRRSYTFVPVEGTIMRNGDPLVGVQVVFFPDPNSGLEGSRSSGITDETGHYRLSTTEGNVGSVVGPHRVCIVELPAQDPLTRLSRRTDGTSELAKKLGLKTDEKPTKPKLPTIYGQIQETPLRAEVRPGSIQIIDFDIP